MIDIKSFQEEAEVVCRKALDLISTQLDQEGLTTKESYNLSNAISSLSRSISDLDRSSRDRATLLAQVRTEVKQLFQLEMSGHPELCEQVWAVLDEVCDQVEIADEGRNQKLLTNKRNM